MNSSLPLIRVLPYFLMSGLLFLTEEEFRRQREARAEAPACEQAEEPVKSSELPDQSALSEDQQVKSRLKELGLLEAQVRGKVVLVSKDSGKRFTSHEEQQRSVLRISRRVPCSRVMPPTSFSFHPNISSTKSRSPQPSTMPSTNTSSPQHSLKQSLSSLKSLTTPVTPVQSFSTPKAKPSSHRVFQPLESRLRRTALKDPAGFCQAAVQPQQTVGIT